MPATSDSHLYSISPHRGPSCWVAHVGAPSCRPWSWSAQKGWSPLTGRCQWAWRGGVEGRPRVRWLRKGLASAGPEDMWVSSTSTLGWTGAKGTFSPSSPVPLVGMEHRPPCLALTWPPWWGKKSGNVSSGSSSEPLTPRCNKVSLVAGTHLWMCSLPQPYPSKEASSTRPSFPRNLPGPQPRIIIEAQVCTVYLTKFLRNFTYIIMTMLGNQVKKKTIQIIIFYPGITSFNFWCIFFQISFKYLSLLFHKKWSHAL